MLVCLWELCEYDKLIMIIDQLENLSCKITLFNLNFIIFAVKYLNQSDKNDVVTSKFNIFI